MVTQQILVLLFLVLFLLIRQFQESFIYLVQLFLFKLHA